MTVSADLDAAVDRARTATNTHYERPPEYFAAFLDRRMKYSSARYDGQDLSLDDAQTAKLSWVADQLDLGPGKHLLDVGCGWGSLTLFAAAERGATVTGVTPAGPQVEHIRAQAAELGVADRVTILVGGFTGLDVPGRFDAVSMLGSIVHMPDRVQVLRQAYGLLRTGGRLYLSESCFRNAEAYQRFKDRPGTLHVTESTFGFADMVPLSVLVAAAETAGFSLTSLTDLTDDYYRTIEAWIGRATENAAFLDTFEGGSEHLLRYLETANAGWGYTTKHYAFTGRRKR
jgi:cyclopropane-fatty-acyl-phospholipid synthase